MQLNAIRVYISDLSAICAGWSECRSLSIAIVIVCGNWKTTKSDGNEKNVIILSNKLKV